MAFLGGIASTVEGVLAKIRFVRLLEEKVDDLETWPYYEEWLDRIDADLSDLVHVQPDGQTLPAAVQPEPSLFDMASDLDNSIGALRTIEANLDALAGSSNKVVPSGLYPLVDTVRTAIKYLRAPMNQLYAAARSAKGAAS